MSEKVLVRCEFSISEKCKKEFQCSKKNMLRTKSNNNGKIICLFCSRTLKFSGRLNPNAKFLTLDDNFFNEVDTESKAYLLGWIASDGSVCNSGFTTAIDSSDKFCLEIVKNIICPEITVTEKTNTNLVSFTVNSQKLIKDICKHLEIEPGKKSDSVNFPKLNSDELSWAFIRGYFDGDGSINKPNEKNRYPKCDITSNSKSMRDSIVEFCKIPCSNSDKTNRIYWSHNNVLDFLDKMYQGASYYLSRKRDLYLDWSIWVPSIKGSSSWGRDDSIKWNKSRIDAVAPSKSKASDSGYDLVLLEKTKQFGLVELYDTGIKILPPFGWYFDLVPRSSIIKSGYVLANSVGIIDRTYTGSILVPLIKIDPNAPDLKLPQKLVQLIPRQIVHFQMNEVDSLDETARGAGGFGSTGA